MWIVLAIENQRIIGSEYCCAGTPTLQHAQDKHAAEPVNKSAQDISGHPRKASIFVNTSKNDRNSRQALAYVAEWQDDCKRTDL